MSGPYTITVGNRGRVVLPVELRQNRNWGEGTTLVAVDADGGILLCTRDELVRLVRSTNKGTGVVESLIAERRAAAADDDRT